MLILASFPPVDIEELGVRHCKLPEQSWVSTISNEGFGRCLRDVLFSSKIKVSLSDMTVDLELLDAVGLVSHDNMVYQDNACADL